MKVPVMALHANLKRHQWTMGGKLVLLALFAFSGITRAGDKYIPSRPLDESVENCKAYKDEAYQALHNQFQKELSCISSTRANISEGEECNDLTGRVHQGVMAWPQCQDAEYHCALVKASENATLCMKQAKSREVLGSPKIDSMLSHVTKADTLFSQVKGDYQAVKNPAEYLRSRVIDKLTEDNKHTLINSVFDGDGKLSPYGIKVTDEFYNWGFKKTTLESNLISSNPIIQAIQSESFSTLGNMQNQMLGELQALRGAIKNMEAHYSQPPNPGRTVTQTSRPKKAVRSEAPIRSSPECAILSDGVVSSNLSIDHPGQFEALVKKCGG